MKKIALLAIARPSFLVLAPACVLLGAATAYLQTGHLDIILLCVVMAGAVLGHASVNAFNEYADFKSGLDATTKRTPFSGGTGYLPSHPEQASAALVFSFILFAGASASGIYLFLLRGYVLLLIWGAGLVLVAAYSPMITKAPLLSLLSPGAGFGFVMVWASHYALSGSFSAACIAASFAPFFLVNNLLLLNQFPDVEPDREVGRRNLPLLAGRRTASYIYVFFTVCAYASIIVSVVMSWLPVWSLAGCATALIAVPSALGAVRNADRIEKLLPFMGMNVVINIATPVFIAAGIFFAGR